MDIYIYIALSLIIIVLSYTTWNILKKFEEAQDTILELEDEIGELRVSIKKAYNDMKEIDSKEIFQSDDEVGQTFKQLLDILQKLDRSK